MSFFLKDYHYDLPEELIAKHPIEPRDESRLLVLDVQAGSWQHRQFKDLPEYLNANDWLVANNSKVIKARLLGRRLLPSGQTGGAIEFLMLEELAPLLWQGAFKASAGGREGVRFRVTSADLQKSVVGEIVCGSEHSPQGLVQVRFDCDPIAADVGEVPLPHYIKRDEVTANDVRLYQTSYAKPLGSAAAPTAGFHFTPSLFHALKEKSVNWGEVTLHVGLGTFRPVKTEDVREHVMHEERYEVSSELAEGLNQWLTNRQNNHHSKLTAVGTTTVRTLESAWNHERQLFQPGAGRTGIFLYPGVERNSGSVFAEKNEAPVISQLVTNFHLPCSTLLMLVSAFAGRDLVLAAYAEAVKQRYRFFSYGDAMLIRK